MAYLLKISLIFFCILLWNVSYRVLTKMHACVCATLLEKLLIPLGHFLCPSWFVFRRQSYWGKGGEGRTEFPWRLGINCRQINTRISLPVFYQHFHPILSILLFFHDFRGVYSMLLFGCVRDPISLMRVMTWLWNVFMTWQAGPPHFVLKTQLNAQCRKPSHEMGDDGHFLFSSPLSSCSYWRFFPIWLWSPAVVCLTLRVGPARPWGTSHASRRPRDSSLRMSSAHDMPLYGTAPINFSNVKGQIRVGAGTSCTWWHFRHIAGISCIVCVLFAFGMQMWGLCL